MSVVDQSTDHVMAHLMRRVADRPKLASAVADIDVDRDSLQTLPDSAFAWPEKRAYPIHTPEQALLSRVYREGASVPPHVDRALKEASEIYGLDEQLFAGTKTAAAETSRDTYLLPGKKRLPVTGAADVKTAQEQLRTQAHKLSVTDRALAANRLTEKAASLGVPVRPEIQKMAGLTVTDTRQLADWIDARAAAASEAYRSGYTKLAGSVRALPRELRDRNMQVKLAEALYTLDTISGVSRHYNRKLLDPMMTVFNTSKTAGNGVNLAGRHIPLERLAAYEPSFFADVLGPDIVREASDDSGRMDTVRLAQVLETLPADMQRVLSAQIR